MPLQRWTAAVRRGAGRRTGNLPYIHSADDLHEHQHGRARGEPGLHVEHRRKAEVLDRAERRVVHAAIGTERHGDRPTGERRGRRAGSTPCWTRCSTRCSRGSDVNRGLAAMAARSLRSRSCSTLRARRRCGSRRTDRRAGAYRPAMQRITGSLVVCLAAASFTAGALLFADDSPRSTAADPVAPAAAAAPPRRRPARRR